MGHDDGGDAVSGEEYHLPLLFLILVYVKTTYMGNKNKNWTWGRTLKKKITGERALCPLVNKTVTTRARIENMCEKIFPRKELKITVNWRRILLENIE